MVYPDLEREKNKLNYILQYILQLLKQNQEKTTEMSEQYINPFDEYLSSVKTPDISLPTKNEYKTRVVMPRIRYINKGVQRKSYNKLKKQLRETQQKLSHLEQISGDAISRLYELEKQILPTPIEDTKYLCCGCNTISYNIKSSAISIGDLGGESITRDVDNSVLYYHKFNIDAIPFGNGVGGSSYILKDEQFTDIIGQFDRVKIIRIYSSSDYSFSPFSLEQRGLCSEQSSKLRVSGKFINALTLLIHNNNQCELHFRMGINSFMLAHICSNIKLRHVSKIIVYFQDDIRLYSSYQGRNPQIKMTQTEFTTSQIKLFMDSIKKKYHDKIHIIRSTFIDC